MHSWLAMGLLVARALAAAAPEPLSLRNARAVYKEGRAHVVIDCADKAEYPERDECGFGAICCAFLPDDLEQAVQVKQGGPFAVSVARNAIRIDGPFAQGDYDVSVQPLLRTRRGSTLKQAFTARVHVDAPASAPAPVPPGPPLRAPVGDPPLPASPGLPVDALTLRVTPSSPAQEASPWTFSVARQGGRTANPNVEVRAECLARLSDDARDKAASSSFHFDSLFGWTSLAHVQAPLDANGGATLACPPLTGAPLVRGPKVLAAMVTAHDAKSGALLGRALVQTALKAQGPTMTLRASAMQDGCPMQMQVSIAIDRPRCASAQLRAEAVWTEWAWDYGGGRERSIVQPWRTPLDAEAFAVPVRDQAWSAQWKARAETLAPDILLRARCGDAEVTELVTNPCVPLVKR